MWLRGKNHSMVTPLCITPSPPSTCNSLRPQPPFSLCVCVCRTPNLTTWASESQLLWQTPQHDDSTVSMHRCARIWLHPIRLRFTHHSASVSWPAHMGFIIIADSVSLQKYCGRKTCLLSTHSPILFQLHVFSEVFYFSKTTPHTQLYTGNRYDKLSKIESQLMSGHWPINHRHPLWELGFSQGKGKHWTCSLSK